MAVQSVPTIVVENDNALRLATILLDPELPQALRAAFADYVAHDEPDFDGWVARSRAEARAICPSRLVVVDDQEQLRKALPQADGVIVEALNIGSEELALAPRLRFVQKYGMVLRNIDLAACKSRNVPVLIHRRLINVAVAEHAIAMMMALSKKLNIVSNLITPLRFKAAGLPLRPYDTQHTPNGNYGRVAGLKLLLGAKLGLIGFGEIGREVARLARGIGMDVAYFQRTRLSAEEEREFGVAYAAFDDVLAQSDVVSLHIPKEVTGLLKADALSRMKQGAILLNIGNAHAVDKSALIDALRSGHLGGIGFDLHWTEPADEDDPMLAFSNVILTPHLAAATRQNSLRDAATMAAGMARALEGR